MNLLARKIMWAVAALIALTACEDPSNIGSELSPDSQVGVFFVKLPVETSMVLGDSINTTGTGVLLAGHTADPQFGTLDANANFTLRLSQLNVTPDVDEELSSMVMTLELNTAQGNNLQNSQQLILSRLTDTLDTKTYYQFENVPFGATLGEVEITKDQYIDANGELLATADSVVIITIPIDEVFAENLFAKFKQGDNIFKTDAAFQAFFKGAALRSIDPNNSVVFNFDATSLSTKMSMFYKAPADSVDKEYSFFVTRRQFNHINLNRDVPPLNGITQKFTDFNAADSVLYAMCGTGLMIKTSLEKTVQNFLDSTSNENIIINRAELIYGNVNESQPNSLYIAPPRLQLYLTDNSNLFMNVDGTKTPYIRLESEYIPDLAAGDKSPLYVPYYINSYKSTLTLYIQELYDGTQEDYTFFLYPLSTGTSVNRYTVKKEDIFLNFYYSKVITD